MRPMRRVRPTNLRRFVAFARLAAAAFAGVDVKPPNIYEILCRCSGLRTETLRLANKGIVGLCRKVCAGGLCRDSCTCLCRA